MVTWLSTLKFNQMVLTPSEGADYVIFHVPEGFMLTYVEDPIGLYDTLDEAKEAAEMHECSGPALVHDSHTPAVAL